MLRSKHQWLSGKQKLDFKHSCVDRRSLVATKGPYVSALDFEIFNCSDPIRPECFNPIESKETFGIWAFSL